MSVEFVTCSGGKSLGRFKKVFSHTTVGNLKKQLHKLHPKLHPDRVSLRLEPKGKSLNDDLTVTDLKLGVNSTLYVKDLGRQIGWKTVFLAEYAGPLGVYLLFYQRPWLFYGADAAGLHSHSVVHIAAACYIFHYVKRILETLFVHRFSHATMPMFNLFKNCFYYWMFTAYVAYHINHPLYTVPPIVQVYFGLIAFVICELGNLSIHLALRNLRPPGTKVRKIPIATSNPFTTLFNYVSCPNYTYEFGSWLSFTIMTQCLPAGLFALAGMYQMTVWALGKHRNYKKEFPNYPKKRKAILPFLL
ncbi:hypothetical protein RUM43_003840 [Polyplax serrata]|uniref:very-long-chain enoyl-CoA reductase n=1 Tax=Polyplax serrata TaxID=468196 RepID=A0AAN8PF97_POLSC